MFVEKQNLSACRIAIEFFIDHGFRPSSFVDFSIENVKKKLVKLTEIFFFDSSLKKKFSSEPSFFGNSFDKFLLHIIFSSNEQVHSLNRKYRGFDNPTDVLTFINEDSLPETPQGEIYISIDMAVKQSRERGLKLSEELCLLSVHGILHSLGLDHERSKTEASLMREHESRLLKAIDLEHVYPLTCTSGV